MAFYNVEIYTAPSEPKLSKKGQTWTKFQVRFDNQICEALCFGPTANKAVSKLAAGIKAQVDGKFEYKSDTPTIFIFDFKIDRESQELVEHQKQRQLDNQEAVRLHERDGEVQVTKGHRKLWVKRDKAMLVNDVWHDPFEWALEILGGAIVTGILREKGASFVTTGNEGRKKILSEIITLAKLEYANKNLSDD